MKRDPRLRSLSSDHHRALVMARKMERASEADRPDASALQAIEAFCRDELQPHFVQEEELLLPALERHGEGMLVERTLREHARMLELSERLDRSEALRELATLLRQHVRFEEQELFEVAQAKLSDAELERIGEQANPAG